MLLSWRWWRWACCCLIINNEFDLREAKKSVANGKCGAICIPHPRVACHTRTNYHKLRSPRISSQPASDPDHILCHWNSSPRRPFPRLPLLHRTASSNRWRRLRSKRLNRCRCVVRETECIPSSESGPGGCTDITSTILSRCIPHPHALPQAAVAAHFFAAGF